MGVGRRIVAAIRAISAVCSSAPRMGSAPNSLERAPPSKSARTVTSAMAGNWRWLGMKSRMGDFV